MKEIVVIKSKVDLMNAIEEGTETMFIGDPSLFCDIKTIKSTSKFMVFGAISALGFGVVNFWNPLGAVALGGLVGVVGGRTVSALREVETIVEIAGETTKRRGIQNTLMAAIFALGGISAWAIYNGYNFKSTGEYSLPDGTVIKAELILEKN